MWIIIITNRITQNEQQINLTYEGYYSNYYLLEVWGRPWESISLLQMALSSVLRNLVICEQEKLAFLSFSTVLFQQVLTSVKFRKFNKVVAYKV